MRAYVLKNTLALREIERNNKKSKHGRARDMFGHSPFLVVFYGPLGAVQPVLSLIPILETVTYYNNVLNLTFQAPVLEVSFFFSGACGWTN